MYSFVDSLKVNAQKSFEENIAKPSIEISKRGKKKIIFLYLFKL